MAILFQSCSANAYCGLEERTIVTMVSHGHDVCPHCNVELEGNESQCPSCGGALFGVARRASTAEIAKDKAMEIAGKTSDAISTVTDKAGAIGKSAISTIGDGLEKATTKIGEISIPTFRSSEEEAETGTIPIMDAPSESVDDSPVVENEVVVEKTAINQTSMLISEGEALAAAGRPNDAAEKFRNAIATDPTNADCWFNLGVVQEQMGNADESIKSFHVALVHDDNHGPAMANLAVLLDAMGDSGASEMARKALNHFPGHPVLTGIASSTPVETHSQSLPIETENESTKITPVAGLVIGANTSSANETPEPSVEEINDVEEVEIFEEESVEEIVQISQTSESPSQPWGAEQDNEMNRAAEMLRKGGSLEVIELIEGDFIQRYSNQARPHKILGAAYALQDRVEEAIASFTTGLNLDNNDAPGWYNLGRLHIRNGHNDAGFTCFTAAQMVDSTHLSSARAIVEYLRESNDYSKLVPAWIHLSTLEDLGESASELAKILVEIGEGESIMIESNPDLPRTLPEGPELGRTASDLLKDEESPIKVRALSLAGEHTDATRISKAILERNTDDPNSWRLMAKVLEAQGNSERAAQCREKANKLENGQTELITESIETPSVDNQQIESALVEDDPQEESDPWGDLMDDQPEESPSSTNESNADNESDLLSMEEEVSQVEETIIPQSITPETDDVVAEPNDTESISAADLLAPVEQDEFTSQPVDNPEVDLAKAALDAASKMISDSGSSASADSGSMANSSVEWYNKALFLMEDKKYSEALSCFDKALGGATEDEDLAIRVLNGRGHAFYYMEQYPEAIKAYFEAMRINKDKVTGATLYNMGTAYAFVELYDDAIKCFKQAMPRGLEDEQKKMCKEQIKRCNELQKIQKRKLSR